MHDEHAAIKLEPDALALPALEVQELTDPLPASQENLPSGVTLSPVSPIEAAPLSPSSPAQPSSDSSDEETDSVAAKIQDLASLAAQPTAHLIRPIIEPLPKRRQRSTQRSRDFTSSTVRTNSHFNDSPASWPWADQANLFNGKHADEIGHVSLRVTAQSPQTPQKAPSGLPTRPRASHKRDRDHGAQLASAAVRNSILR